MKRDEQNRQIGSSQTKKKLRQFRARASFVFFFGLEQEGTLLLVGGQAGWTLDESSAIREPKEGEEMVISLE